MTAVDTGPVRPGAHLPEHPDFLWRTPEPKKTYDVVIVGGDGHGLATAHYLAKNHGITNVAVLERAAENRQGTPGKPNGPFHLIDGRGVSVIWFGPRESLVTSAEQDGENLEK